MITWVYDKTFEGFLTLVFESYELKTFPNRILGEMESRSLIFQGDYKVVSDETKAQRVWTGLGKKVSGQSCQLIYAAFLSEMKDVELLILGYIREIFASTVNIEMNFGNAHVLKMFEIGKKVAREAHRIPMFVRFQKTADDIYYASFDPRYNLLPLAVPHFEERFADQQWLIYDTRRNYGFYYNLKKTEEITFTNNNVNPINGKIDSHLLDKDEELFQDMWKSYFKAICIKERINPKLHKQLLPKRFWKYLIEKQ